MLLLSVATVNNKKEREISIRLVTNSNEETNTLFVDVTRRSRSVGCGSTHRTYGFFFCTWKEVRVWAHVTWNVHTTKNEGMEEEEKENNPFAEGKRTKSYSYSPSLDNENERNGGTRERTKPSSWFPVSWPELSTWTFVNPQVHGGRDTQSRNTFSRLLYFINLNKNKNLLLFSFFT